MVNSPRPDAWLARFDYNYPTIVSSGSGARLEKGYVPMSGGFACPECGQSIALRGLTPGREVICPACATLVEVPYLPRATGRPRRPDNRAEPRLPGRRSRSRAWRGGGMSLAARRRLVWGVALGAVGLVALTTWWAVGSIESRARSDRERVLDELIAASEAAATAGDPGGAFREIEAALTQARKLDPNGSARLEALVDRRDHAARAEVEARLATLDKLAPDARAGEALILDERTRRDPALAALADQVGGAVESALTTQAETDRDRGRAALQAGRGLEAFQLASRAHDRADRLATRAAATRIEGEARQIIVDAVERFGAVRADPTASPPGADSTEGFVVALWTEALAHRGYLLAPGESRWSAVWTAHAPYQVSARVVESHEGLYLQSQNRPTQIDGQFAVTLRSQPRWQTRIYAQTRAPIPDLAAFVASRLATADHRDAEIERRFRDDARTAFRAQADRNFRAIPPPGPAADPAARSPSS